jgi:transposase
MAQRFAGFDLHKKEIEVCIIDDSGKILRRDRITADRNSITHFATGHNLIDCIVALEATTNTWPVANLLKPLCADVIVSNPLRTKAIAQARIKTDKVDALVLAQLLRTDFLPQVWIPDDHTRRMRDLTTQRSMLVSDSTRIKNRIHATLHQRLIPAPGGDLFSPHNLQWLRCSITIDEDGRQALDRQLRLLDQIEAELLLLTDKLAQLAYQDNQVQLLMTLPGIDFAIAQAILAAFGDITRFSSANKAAANLGLVPSTRQSGDKCYHGPITVSAT